MSADCSVLDAGEDFLQYGSRGVVTNLAIDALVEAFQGSDPVSVHFGKPDEASQRAFWSIFCQSHIADSKPCLNFVSKGGQAAVVGSLMPQQQVSWFASKRSGVRLLLRAVPPSKWMALAAFGGWLEAKQREFLKARGPFIYVVSIGVRPEAQGKGAGGKLLARLLQEVDKREMPAYLEASTPDSRRLYLRHGFEDIETWQGAFPVYRMQRPARSRRNSPGEVATAPLPARLVVQR